MAESDSDATYIDESEDDSTQPLGKPASKQRNTSVKNVVSIKRSASAHNISDSGDSDDSDSKRNPSQSLPRQGKGPSCQKSTANRSQVNIASSSKSSATSTLYGSSGSKTYETQKRKCPSPDDGRVGGNVEGKPKCQFGAECYRKNPNHLREFHHSDDSDDEKPHRKKLKKDPSMTKASSSATARASSHRMNCLEVIQETSPLCFLLTRVTGIAEKYNSLAVHISDILSPCMGDLVASAQFNYMFDIPWLMRQYPAQFRSKPLVIVHGEQRQSKSALHTAAHQYSNIKLCQAKLDIMYGTHHSKMMLLLYSDGMRVVIHTANIIDRDWHQKTQGVWISPLFPRIRQSGSSTAPDSPTFFRRDLVEYLAVYRSPLLQEWIDHVQKHDMSSAKVYIVGSVPGRHTGGASSKWGHLKLRQVLKDHGPKESDVKDWPVIGQFSSVGSLGPDKDKWLCAEWLQSMSQCRGVTGRVQAQSVRKALKLIFPSKDNIRTSLEGYPAGGSVPYSIKTAKKQVYFHAFLHQWASTTRGRSRASPHIKTYSRLSPTDDHIAWFLVTSANMSKAAWGALEKNAH